MNSKHSKPFPSRAAPSGQLPAIQLKLKQAIAFHQSGELSKAELLYRDILKIQKSNADALHLLGVVAIQKKNTAAGADLIARSLSINPRQPTAQSNLGKAWRELGRSEDALSCFDKAIALKADFSDAHYDRGNVLGDLKRHVEAIASYDKTILLKPDYAEAHNNRGVSLDGLGRHQEALLSYEIALALMPGYAEAHHNRGIVFLKLKRHEEALACFERAIAVKPDYAEAHHSKGIAHMGLKQYQCALSSFDQAMAINRHFPEACNSQGVTLGVLNRYADALKSYDKALELHPEYVEAHDNRGVALDNLRRHEEALESFAKALAIRPEYSEAHYNESLCRLRMGDFSMGWKKHEWRWRVAQAAGGGRNFNQPLWLGLEPLAGKTILLHAEQGLGDTLQFCRYATVVASLGATVLLEVQEPLKALLTGLEGVSRLFARGEALPAFDFHCPLLSLPLAFDTQLETIPAAAPYIAADVDTSNRWKAKSRESGVPSVGLVWSGNAEHMNDRNRSIPLQNWLSIRTHTARFISLQKEVRHADRAILDKEEFILDFSDGFSNFSETAALVSNLDLVISVDTSIAHLAGAMGKPVWVLLPYHADWRWLLDRDQSPWYPTMRLFRQPVPGDWEVVIQSVNEALNHFCTGFPDTLVN